MQTQSVSRLAPVGVNAALQANSEARPKIFDEFALTDRVGIVSGGNRGLGLEMALALCEAGARVIYCIDLPEKPSEEWNKTKEFVDKMKNGSRLEYISADVTDQERMWKIGEEIGAKEKRMDVCVAAAGILKSHTDCLDYPAKQFQDVSKFLSV
jgi:NAD(P)-dependent dehydrogenase (short-subunit alcohol dehydrogenase family)